MNSSLSQFCFFCLFAVPLLVGCFTILWFWLDHVKKKRTIHKKEIFISADCWLSVFELLSPRKLGLDIALISHRFDYYVDEHFKTRRWSLGLVQIWRKKEKNGTKQMQNFNCRGESMEIPQKSMPKKVIGYKHLLINYIDHNAIEFLRRFSSVFANCGIYLSVQICNDDLLERVLLNVWPLLEDKIRGMILWPDDLDRLRSFGHSSILNDCPSLRFVLSYYDDIFPEFPPDDCVDASDEQSLAKWLFSPRPDGVPKVLKCHSDFDEEEWPSQIEGLKKAFSIASSRANFIIVICDPSANDFIVPFDLANELTRERLTLKSANNNKQFLLIRCPFSRDENQWTKWEKEAIELEILGKWNTIDIAINEEEIGDGLIDCTSDSSDDTSDSNDGISDSNDGISDSSD